MGKSLNKVPLMPCKPAESVDLYGKLLNCVYIVSAGMDPIS